MDAKTRKIMTIHGTIDDLQNRWRDKRMYSQFLQELKDDVDQTKSWSWVKTSDLKSCTTALIFSTEEQAVRINYSKFYIDRAPESPLCRCGAKGESFSHLVSDCSKLAQT